MIQVKEKMADVHLSDAFETKRFQMQETPEAFAAVIDTLYENKILSPKREYMTNAADGHAAIGSTEPFNVQLPTQLDPMFKVRDFGPGLSHEEILSHMTTLFSSSKRETNEQTGYLGLGSKSIFAYTNSGQITSWHEGIKRFYTVARDEDGVPIVTLVSEKPSDEPSGVEVAYAVKQTDIAAFKDAALALRFGFSNWPVQPKYNLDLGPMPEPVYEADNVRIYATGLGLKEGIYIQQGPVVYPVTNSIVWPHKIKAGFVYIFTVPIGTVKVATSRETLSLDENTKAKVNGLVNTFVDELCAAASEELNKANNLAELDELQIYGFMNESYKFKNLEICLTWDNQGYVIIVELLKTLLGKQQKRNPKDTWDGWSYVSGGHIYLNGAKKYQIIYTLKGEDRPKHSDRRLGATYYPNSQYLVIEHVTKAELQKLTDFIGTEAKPIAWKDLPDPGPSKPSWIVSATSNASKAHLPYVLKIDTKAPLGCEFTQLTEDPDPDTYLWLQVPKKYGRIDCLDRKGLRGEDFLRLIGNMVKLGEDLGVDLSDLGKKKIIAFTSVGVKKFDPPEDHKLEPYLKEALAPLKKPIKDWLTAKAKYEAFTGNYADQDGLSTLYTHKIVTKKQYAELSDWSNYPGNGSSYYTNRYIADYTSLGLLDTKITVELPQWFKDMKDKYPIIFEIQNYRNNKMAKLTAFYLENKK